MRIFIAYSYQERDRWIENLIFPLIFNAAQLNTGSRLRLHITTSEGVFVSDFENVDDVNLPIALAPTEDRFADPRPRALETVLRTV